MSNYLFVLLNLCRSGGILFGVVGALIIGAGLIDDGFVHPDGERFRSWLLSLPMLLVPALFVWVPTKLLRLLR